MSPWPKLCAAGAALCLILPLYAGELGDPAAGLKIKEWVKGQPVDVTKADGNHVYVVEFWATWCGPCRVSIPHLSELQKKYNDKVTIIGVSIDDERTVEQVNSFVERMGDKMSYTVAIDDDRGTSDGYMKAFGINGIPHAFVVQNGKIVWHQNPHPESSDGELGEVLDMIVAGKFDKAAGEKRLEEGKERTAAARKKSEQLNKLMREYFELVGSTDKHEEAGKLGAKLFEAATDNANALNGIAWTILTDEDVVTRDLAFALKAAERANELTKGQNASILDTYALALFDNGQKKEALKYQEKAVELAKESGNDELIKELAERLEKFRKEQ